MALDDNRLLEPVKKLRKLIKKIDKGPNPDAVHDLRTNTRRFETRGSSVTVDPRRR
jgi:hypothetical protein